MSWLDETEQRAKEATSGPWAADEYGMYVFGADEHMVADLDPSDVYPGDPIARIRGHGAEVSGQRPEGSQEANLRFIASSRSRNLDGCKVASRGIVCFLVITHGR